MEDSVIEALHAHLIAYHSLVIALHEARVLPIQAVSNQIGHRLEADQVEHQHQNPVARQIYEGLLELETVLRPFDEGRLPT